MGGGYAEAFGHAGAELGRGNYFEVAAVAEQEAFEFVVDHYF